MYNNRRATKEAIIEYAVTIPQQLKDIPGFVHQLDHLYIQKEDEEEDEEEGDFLVTAEELMENGYLDMDNIKKLNETNRSKIIFGVAAAMKSLYNKNLKFGGLCIRHIFLDSLMEPRIRISTPTVDPSTTLPSYFKHYQLFWPIESLEEEEKITEAHDVYSYGFVLFFLFGGKIVQHDYHQWIKFIRKGKRPEKPSGIPDNFWELIQRCWNHDPSKRPSFKEIVELLRTGDFFNDSKIDINSLNEYQDRVDPKSTKELLDEISKLKKKLSRIPQKQTQKSSPSINILSEEEISQMRTIEKIGKGGSALVEKVSRDEFFALKTLEQEGLTIEKLKRFLQEYEILNQLVHPNIVKVYGFYYGNSSHGPSILLEFCPKNLVNEVVNKSLSNVQIACIVYQIVEGMKFVHLNGIIHRDLKPHNILIDKDGRVKIADFGIAKLVSLETQTSNVGTQKFMAPELLNEVEKYDNKVDVYSFGVLLYWILNNGEMPKITIIQMGTGKMAKIPDSVNKFATKLIKDCWSFDPDQRPSFDSISKQLRSNNFKVLNLSAAEVKQVESFVKNNDKEIGL